jgi:hypothetical protein
MSKKLNAKTSKKFVAPIEPDKKGLAGEDTFEMKYNASTERHNLTKNGEFIFSGFAEMCLYKAVQLGITWEN